MVQKSSKPVDMVAYPIIYRVSYMLGGAGFLPSFGNYDCAGKYHFYRSVLILDLETDRKFSSLENDFSPDSIDMCVKYLKNVVCFLALARNQRPVLSNPPRFSVLGQFFRVHHPPKTPVKPPGMAASGKLDLVKKNNDPTSLGLGPSHGCFQK